MSIPSEAARREAIAKVLAAEEQDVNAVRHEIRWKDGSVRLTQIEIRLDTVVLNPRSHRIQAQLASRPDAEVVQQDPFSEAAQDILAEEIRRTEGFERIKRSLDDEGQHDPGVITRAGVLVNANTRAVALRELPDRDYIKVMVLPEGAGQSEIAELELRLQMRPDLRENYTFTNELLFIRECLDNGWSEERVADELRYTSRHGSQDKGVAHVRKQRRMLDLIEELRDKSGKRLTYRHFDEANVALDELDSEYIRRKSVDPEAATRMRDVRIAGLLADVPYRDLREMDSEFVETYLMEEVENDPMLRRLAGELFAPSDEDPEGVAVLGGESEGDAAANLSRWLTRTAGDKHVFSRSESGDLIKDERSDVLANLQEAMRAAAEAVRHDRRDEDLVDSPRRRVSEARRKVKKAFESLARARRHDGFPATLGTLKYEARKLAKESSDLVDAIGDEMEKQNP